MGYIVDHEIIKLWNIYKPIFWIKRGLVYKTINQLKKCARQPEKRAMTQRYRYSASLLSNKNRRKNQNPKSGFSRSFCYSLAKSNVFAPLTSLCDVQRKTLLPRAMGCPPFLAHHGPKNSLRFSAHFCGLEKNRCEQRTEKIASRNFCLPIFC